MFYTVSEVAAEIRCSEKTVRRLIDAGYLNILRFGTRIRVPQDEIERIRQNGIPTQRNLSSSTSISHLRSPGGRSRKEGRLWVK